MGKGQRRGEEGLAAAGVAALGGPIPQSSLAACPPHPPPPGISAYVAQQRLDFGPCDMERLMEKVGSRLQPCSPAMLLLPTRRRHTCSLPDCVSLFLAPAPLQMDVEFA